MKEFVSKRTFPELCNKRRITFKFLSFSSLRQFLINNLSGEKIKIAGNSLEPRVGADPYVTMYSYSSLQKYLFIY